MGPYKFDSKWFDLGLIFEVNVSGRFLAEVTKEVLLDLEASRYQVQPSIMIQTVLGYASLSFYLLIFLKTFFRLLFMSYSSMQLLLLEIYIC